MKCIKEMIEKPADCKYRISECIHSDFIRGEEWIFICSVNGIRCPNGMKFPEECPLEDTK